MRPRLEPELRQREGRAAERVGFHHIGPGLEIAAMNLPHEVRTGQIQHFRAVFLVPVIPLDIERQRLHPAAHAAVAEQHMVPQRIKKVWSGHG